MIEISPSKVVQIIFLAREEGKADTELAGFIDNLNDDEKAHLTAIAWVGRGSYDPGDYVAALNNAYTEATVPTSVLTNIERSISMSMATMSTIR